MYFYLSWCVYKNFRLSSRYRTESKYIISFSSEVVDSTTLHTIKTGVSMKDL